MADPELTSSHIRAVSAAGVEISLRITGVGGRCFAYAIDWHIRVIVTFAWAMAVSLFFTGGLNTETLAGMDPSTGKRVLYVGILPALAAYLLYHPLFELLMKGRTPGKRRAGVRIVTREGQTPGVGAILIRNVFRLVDALPGFYMIGLVTALFTKQHVRIGDLAAGTLLVYEEKPSALNIEAMVASGEEALTTEQREIAVELLERWNQLDRVSRIRMSDAFLAGVGQTPERNRSAVDADRTNHSLLTKLLGKSS